MIFARNGMRTTSLLLIITILYLLFLVELPDVSRVDVSSVVSNKANDLYEDVTRNRFIITDNISINTKWSEDQGPYVVTKNIFVGNRSVLEICPGTTVSFDPNANIYIDPYESGEGCFIKAHGTEEKRITFISRFISRYKHFHAAETGNFSFRYCDFYNMSTIDIISTKNSNLYRCNFYNCEGIRVDEDHDLDCMYGCSKNNTIVECNFINTTNPVRILTNGASNRIYSNNFINCVFNEQITSGLGGIWNDSHGHGNYWSDYNGADLDNDGIGDTNLPWHEVDWCPLMDPSPAINHCNQSWLDKPPYYDPTDKDDDGLPDIWEERNGLDPTDPSDAFKDPDNDGLSNTAEYENNTDPMSDDTDDDYMKDKWEIEHGLDPTDPGDALADADNDGLSNIAEIWNNTDPFSNDTDGDGIPDGWEIINGLDPLNASDAGEDADNDGASNLEEYLKGTDPVHPDSGGDGRKDMSVLFDVSVVVVAFMLVIVFVVTVKQRR